MNPADTDPHKDIPSTDPYAQAWQSRKEEAITFMKGWALAHPPPPRPLHNKGGFSREKAMTALLMPLYPSLTLKEIAGLCGVSYGVIQVWRTQKDYWDEIQRASNELSSHITHEIEVAVKAGIKIAVEEGPQANTAGIEERVRGVLSPITSTIPFLELDTQIRITDWIRSQQDSLTEPGGIPVPITADTITPILMVQVNIYSDLVCTILKNGMVRDRATFKEWLTSPAQVKRFKTAVEGGLEVLSDPKAWTPPYIEKSKALAERVKESVFYVIDGLAEQDPQDGLLGLGWRWPLSTFDPLAFPQSSQENTPHTDDGMGGGEK